MEPKTVTTISDEPIDLLSDVQADIADLVVTAIKRYYGMQNVHKVYHVGAHKPSVEVYSTGWTHSNFRKAQQFAIGVVYGVTLGRGY